MPYITCTVLVTSDVGAQPQQIFEKIARIFVTQEQLLNLQKAGGDGAGVFTALPSVEQSPILNGLIIATDQPLNVRTGGVADGDGIIPLKAGGMVLILDANIASGATTNVKVNNVGTSAATITGLAGGT